jgi:CheY-like chemotaxis protein
MGVLGYAAAIEAHPGYDPALDGHLAEIRRVGERATALTRRLLAFSRREVVQPKLVNLPLIVGELMPMLERVLEEQVRPSFETASAEAWLVACPTQIEQIVLNLVVNARDAMPQGGSIRVWTGEVAFDRERHVGDAVLAAGRYAALRVTDQGTGIEPVVQARMFEPFFTTKEAGRGTGLGLSTVYGIVKQMQGGIEVETSPGTGTSFQIFFPSAPEPERRTTHRATSSAGAGECILLVEDDGAIRGLVALWLKRHGYRTMVASSAAEAQALAGDASGVDLVITDVMMPGGNGPELMKAFHQHKPGLRAIYISGYAHATLTTEGHLPVDTHFVSKPFAERDLVARIRVVLDEAVRPGIENTGFLGDSEQTRFPG